jgi:hypothetical protein
MVGTRTQELVGYDCILDLIAREQGPGTAVYEKRQEVDPDTQGAFIVNVVWIYDTRYR